MSVQDSDANDIELSTFGRPPKPPRTMNHVIRDSPPLEDDALLEGGAERESSPNSPSGGRHERSTDYSDSDESDLPMESQPQNHSTFTSNHRPAPQKPVDSKYVDEDDEYDPALNPFLEPGEKLP